MWRMVKKHIHTFDDCIDFHRYQVGLDNIHLDLATRKHGLVDPAMSPPGYEVGLGDKQKRGSGHISKVAAACGTTIAFGLLADTARTG